MKTIVRIMAIGAQDGFYHNNDMLKNTEWELQSCWTNGGTKFKGAELVPSCDKAKQFWPDHMNTQTVYFRRIKLAVVRTEHR